MLTPRQQEFVRLYLANGNHGKQAAIDAGYKANSAVVQSSQMLARPEIQDEIKRLMAPKTDHQLASVEGRADWLRSIVTGDLRDDEDKPARMAERIKALELLGKMSGDFIERKHVTGDVQLNFTAFVPKKGSK